MGELTDSLASAFDRIADFRSIHEGRDEPVSMEAVLCLWESVGVDESSRKTLGRELDATDGVQRPGEFLLGVVIGLLTAQLAAEREVAR